MNKRDLAKLQRMIDRTVKAQNLYHKAQSVLNDYCREHYGHEPGDIDADGIIDAVFGGCGLSTGMSAREFDEIMSSGA